MPANNRFSDNPFRDPNLTPEQVARIEARNKALRIYRETGDEGPAIENRCISEEEALMERGAIHIISEIGGCIIDLPPDREGIATSLRSYARRQGMEPMELLDPSIDSLGEWAEMGPFRYGGVSPDPTGTMFWSETRTSRRPSAGGCVKALWVSRAWGFAGRHHPRTRTPPHVPQDTPQPSLP